MQPEELKIPGTDWSGVVRNETGENIGTVSVYNGTGSIKEVEAVSEVASLIDQFAGQAEQEGRDFDRDDFRKVLAQVNANRTVKLMQAVNGLLCFGPGTEYAQTRAELVEQISANFGIPAELLQLIVDQNDRLVDGMLKQTTRITIDKADVPSELLAKLNDTPIVLETEQ